MDLNYYRDEAGEFLRKINADNELLETKIKILDEEYEELKKSIDNPEKLKHQIYDVLFLLFEIAYESKFDIEDEWNNGKQKKQNKYLKDSKKSIDCDSTELAELRSHIDELDRQLISLLAERFQLTEKVGLYKAKEKLDAQDKDREKKQFDKIEKLASSNGLNPEYAFLIYRCIIDTVISRHEELKHQLFLE